MGCPLLHLKLKQTSSLGETDPSEQPVVEILTAQLTWEFHLFLFFLAPISIVHGIFLVLISLSLLAFLFLPTRMLISLPRGLYKNIFTLGGGGILCCLHRRLFDRQLMKLLSQRFYGGRVNGPNYTIGMGSRIRLLRIVRRPRCLKDDLI